ncbi:MAG: tyrosine-type recombinase/integrase [Synechococcus sp.]
MTKHRYRKGEVGTHNRDGMLVLRWRFDGKQKTMAVGLPDNPTNRAVAGKIAFAIQGDIATGNYDPTLDKYRTRTESRERIYRSVMSGLRKRIKDRFNSADSALLGVLQAYGRPIGSVGDADKFYHWLCDRQNTSTGKPLSPWTIDRYLDTLKVISPELFGHIKVKLPPRKQVQPFTQDEVERIFTFFEGKPYEEFVRWQFSTGMRTSETIGLRWKDIDLARNRVRVAESLKRFQGSSTARTRGSTKTGKVRVVPISLPLIRMLREMKGDAAPEDLVFEINGKPIDDRNFRRRHWVPALAALGIDYRRPYVMRATCASHLIDAGAPLTRVAAVLGHRVDTLARHYAGTVGNLNLPELYGGA